MTDFDRLRASPAGPFVVGGVALRLAVIAAVGNPFVDDTFIFMRYGQNFAAGRGLVWNEGEHVLGFSSVAYQLGIALLSFLGDPGLSVAIIIVNLGLWTLATVLLVELCRRHFERWWLVPLAWVLYFPLLDASLIGMETMLYCAALLVVISALDTERYQLAGGLALGLVLIRPEAIVVTIPVGIWLLWKVRPIRWKGPLIAAGVGGAWGAIALAYYGTFIPQSLVAKSGIAQDTLARTDFGVVDLPGLLAIGLPSAQFQTLPGAAQIVVTGVGLVAAALGVYGFAAIVRQGSALWLAGAVFYGTLVGFAIGDPVSIWSWYVAPTSMAALILLGAAVDRVEFPAPDRVLAGIATTALVVVGIVGFRERSTSLAEVRVSYDQVVELVQTEAPNASSIMIADIGVVGYRLEHLKVIDLSGLVSLETSDSGSGTPSLSLLIVETCPDVVVFKGPLEAREVIVEGTLARAGFTDEDVRRFGAAYTDLGETAGEPRYVYVRNDVIGADAAAPMCHPV